MSVITERLPHSFPEDQWASFIWTGRVGKEHIQFVPRNKDLINRPRLEVDIEHPNGENPDGHEGRTIYINLEVDAENPNGEGRTAA